MHGSTDQPAPPTHQRHRRIALAVLALPCMLVTMDLTVLFLAVPKLSAGLDTSTTELLWVTDMYGFLIAGSLIVMGALGDRIGHRRVLLAGAAGFGLASLLAALSTTPEMLIAARAAQGVAGAALLPSVMAIVFSMYTDEKERAAALGLIVSGFAAGAALGPVLGGLLLEFFDWNSVFVPNIPLMALVLVLAPRLVPESRNPAAGRIDVTSAALSVVAVLAVVYGIKEAAQHGVDPVRAGAIGLGLAVGTAFVRRQGRLADPLIDVTLFRNRTFCTAFAANVVGTFAIYGVFFFTAQYFQLVVGLSPLTSGLWGMVGVACMMVCAGGIVPKLAERIRPGYLIGAGLGISTLGFVLLVGLGAGDGVAPVVAAQALISIGLAPCATLGTNLIVGAAPPDRSGSVAGLEQSGNELAGALGIALLGTLGTAVYRSEVDGIVPGGLPAQVESAARDTLGGAVGVAQSLPAGVLDAAQVAFVDGLNAVALASIVVLGAAAVLSTVFLRHVPAGPAAPGGHGDDVPAADSDDERDPDAVLVG